MILGLADQRRNVPEGKIHTDAEARRALCIEGRELASDRSDYTKPACFPDSRRKKSQATTSSGDHAASATERTRLSTCSEGTGGP
jgi:hypothetical protein